jgi:hypothetical protein
MYGDIRSGAVKQSSTQGRQRKPPQGPWRRVLLAICLVLLLILSAAVPFLLNMKQYALLVGLAPVVGALIIAIVAVLTWLFPLEPWKKEDQPQLPQSTPSTAQPPSVSALADSPQAVSLTQTSSVSTLLVKHTASPGIGIFHDRTSLPSADEFYGKEYERGLLLSRIDIRASTAIVGEFRMGKSWLMQYIKLVASRDLGSHVHVGMFSATSPECETVPGFVRRALGELGISVHKSRSAKTAMERLAVAVRGLKERSIIPVLCIDEFAGLIGKLGFDRSFVEGLRAILEDDGLVLITSSRRPLHQVIEDIIEETSPLFNVMQEITLKFFTKEEAQIFISEKGRQAGLNQEEQEFFLTCAAVTQSDGKQGWPPLLLQMTGRKLLDAKSGVLEIPHVYDVRNGDYRAAFQAHLAQEYRTMVKHP